MLYRRRLPVQLSPYQGASPGTGHNGGPALDLSWEAWLWRRAHAQAWKPPRREIALHRMKRAERLGLDYKAYAGVLMNRGTHLGAAIFLLDGLAALALSQAAQKIANISDCAVFAGVSDPAGADAALAQRADVLVASGDERAIARAIDRFILARRLTPGGTFMVGTMHAHLRIAEDCGLALFLWARDYFDARSN
jgi:hypothetical protein